MNDLTAKYEGFTCLGFPTNQFGKQTNEKDWELVPMLKHVRPGGGFEPNFPIFTKTEANGEGASALFAFLRSAIRFPCDDFKGQGADHVVAAKNIIWTPVTRTDLAWNFEKFLVNQEGRPVRRYSPGFPTADVAPDIEALLKDGPNALD
jgi:glutathione peroxidase